MQRIPTLALDTPLAVTEVTVPGSQHAPYVLHLIPPASVPCPACGQDRPVRVARRTKRVVDVPYDDHPVVLEVRSGHATCRRCHARVDCDLPAGALLEGRRVTRDLGAYLLRHMGAWPLRTLSRHTGLSHTVINQIQHQMLALEQDQQKAPRIRHLGLDEIYMQKAKYIVAVDHDRRQILKVERLTSALEGQAGGGDIASLLTDLPDAGLITLDMNTEQLGAVKQRWPGATIVIDQRHLLQVLDRDILKLVGELILDRWKGHDPEQLPRRAVQTFGSAAYPYLHLRALVRRRRHTLTPADHAAWLIVRYEGVKGRRLYEAYMWREALYDLYSEPLKPEEMIKGLETWRTRVEVWQKRLGEQRPPLEGILKVMSIHAREIANYAHHRVTNADTELANGGLRRYLRMGHRYKPSTLQALVNRRNAAVPPRPVEPSPAPIQVERWVKAEAAASPLPAPPEPVPEQVAATPEPPSVELAPGNPRLRRPRNLPQRKPELAIPDDVWIWLHTKRGRGPQATTTVPLVLAEAPAADYTAWSLLCAGRVTGRGVPDVSPRQLQHWRAAILRRYVLEQQLTGVVNAREQERQRQLAAIDLTLLAGQSPTLMQQLATAWCALARKPGCASLSPVENAAMTLAAAWSALAHPGPLRRAVRAWRDPADPRRAIWEPWREVAAQAGEEASLPEPNRALMEEVLDQPELRLALAAEWCIQRGEAVETCLPVPLEEARLSWFMGLQNLLMSSR